MWGKGYVSETNWKASRITQAQRVAYKGTMKMEVLHISATLIFFQLFMEVNPKQIEPLLIEIFDLKCEKQDQ